MTVLNDELAPPGTAEMAELCHDLRQPVATILASAASLQAESDLGATSRRAVARIVTEARYLSCVCRQVSTGAQSPIRVDLTALLAETVAAFRVCFAGDIDLVAQPIEVIASPVAVRRAVTNVLDNACRAAGPGGHVRVTGLAHADRATVDVEDDGPGFGRAPGGLGGLGLGIAARQTESCDGELQVIERDSERGGHVRIVLPLIDGSGGCCR